MSCAFCRQKTRQMMTPTTTTTMMTSAARRNRVDRNIVETEQRSALISWDTSKRRSTEHTTRMCTRGRSWLAKPDSPRPGYRSDQGIFTVQSAGGISTPALLYCPTSPLVTVNAQPVFFSLFSYGPLHLRATWKLEMVLDLSHVP